MDGSDGSLFATALLMLSVAIVNDTSMLTYHNGPVSQSTPIEHPISSHPQQEIDRRSVSPVLHSLYRYQLPLQQ
jgi:hypothetical protein